MSDDDYVESIYATARFNVRDALAGRCEIPGDGPKPTSIEHTGRTFFRGGVDLRNVWDDYYEARRDVDPPLTRLHFVMRVLGLSYPDVGHAAGYSHTSVLRLAKKPGVPYRHPDRARAMIRYINEQLERSGYAPVTAHELFPLGETDRSCTLGHYRAWLQAMGE